MRIWMTVASLVFLSAGWLFAQDGPPTIAGHYALEGTTAQGPYRGEAEIEQRGRMVFVVWRLDVGPGVEYSGLGLITGSSLAASYAIRGIGAVAVYQIQGQTLVGEWPDGQQIQRETLTRTAAGSQAQGGFDDAARIARPAPHRADLLGVFRRVGSSGLSLPALRQWPIRQDAAPRRVARD